LEFIIIFIAHDRYQIVFDSRKLLYFRNVINIILKYRSGIFVIYSYEKLNKNIVVNKLFNLINSIGLTEDKYFIGISNYH